LGTAQFGVFSIDTNSAAARHRGRRTLGRTLFSGFAVLHRDDSSPTKLYLARSKCGSC